MTGLEQRTFSVCFPDKVTALAVATVLGKYDPPLTDFTPDGWFVADSGMGVLHVDTNQIGDVWEVQPTYDANGDQLSSGIKRVGWHGLLRFQKSADNPNSIDDMIPTSVLAQYVVTYDVGRVMG